MNDSTTARKANKAGLEAVERMQESTSQATESFRDYQLKVLAAAQANINGVFEYVQDVLNARSFPELVEISTSHSQRQMGRLTEQAREIARAAQQMAIEGARPLGRGFDKRT
jgi:hypothetical protein